MLPQHTVLGVAIRFVAACLALPYVPNVGLLTPWVVGGLDECMNYLLAWRLQHDIRPSLFPASGALILQQRMHFDRTTANLHGWRRDLVVYDSLRTYFKTGTGRQHIGCQP